MWVTGQVLHLFRRDLPGTGPGQKSGIQLADLMDVVCLAPVSCAFLDRPRREARGKSVRQDLPAPEAMQRDPEIAELQGAVGRYKHVPRCDVPMNGSTLMNHRHRAEQMNDLPPRSPLGPGFRIPLEVGVKIPFIHVLGDQAIEWLPAAAWSPGERVVYCDQGWHMPKQMTKVCFTVPGCGVDGYLQDAQPGGGTLPS